MNEKVKYGIFSLIIIIFQSFLKLIGVILTGSLSFLSETVDTMIDIIFIVITLYAVIQSSKPADFEHMYGHEKIDSIGAMIQGIILVNLYILLIYNAISVLASGAYEISNPELGLWILIISFLVNLVFSRILMWQGNKKNSLSLRIQGLNLFQDSMRAVIVIMSFVFVLFNVVILDIFFSIALSVWIIIGAIKLTKEGIKDLTDTNPINKIIIEDLRQEIFNLEHVNAVHNVKVRGSGRRLYLDILLSVEDHISIVHAHEIIKSIRKIGENLFPQYEVEITVQMNPLKGETSLGDSIFNLIASIKADHKEIINIKDLNLFQIEGNSNLSLKLVVDDNLTLDQAHSISSNFEKELKLQSPEISRIITHIESKPKSTGSPVQSKCYPVDEQTKKNIKEIVEEVLKTSEYVKGYHGFEFWGAETFCIIELHVFFGGEMNIAAVHDHISEIENKIRNRLGIQNLNDIILHSEPVKNQKDDDVIIF